MPEEISPLAALAASENQLPEVPAAVVPEAPADGQVPGTVATDSPQPEGVSDEINAALEGKTASEIGALINQLPPEHRGVVEQMRRVFQSRIDKERNEMSNHPSQVLWKSFEDDATGTLEQVARQLGYSLTPLDGSGAGDDTGYPQEQVNPLEQKVSALEQQLQQQQLEKQVDSAVQTIRQMSRNYQLELSDQEIEQIVTKAAQTNWDVETQFRAMVTDKIVNRAAKPLQRNEQQDTEIDDPTARWNMWARQSNS